MVRMVRGYIPVAAAVLLTGLQDAGPGGLADGFRVEADEVVVDVDAGHAAPCFTDLDADGLPDLLVGQFRNGALRIYRNVGTPGQPRFAGFTMFETEEGEGSVPAS